MEENLISKKDLLALTGISYGALYRWKRKGLIPEDWFIKKNTYTGPETYFERGKILPRVDKILRGKEELSLDDMAELFSPAPPEVELTGQELLNLGVLSPAAAGLASFQPEARADFHRALYLAVADRLLRDGSVSAQEADDVLRTLTEGFSRFPQPPMLTVWRRLGVAFPLLHPDGTAVAAPPDAKAAATLRTAPIWEELKATLGGKL